MAAFSDYPTVLLRMLNQCIKEPHIYLAVLLMQPSGEARLDFIQNMVSEGEEEDGRSLFLLVTPSHGGRFFIYPL